MKLKNMLQLVIFFLCVVSNPRITQAVTINYDLLSLGVDYFRYEYIISNDGSLPAGSSIELFDILFPTDQYLESSLTIVTDSSLISDWDELILSSAPGVPAAYDVYALSGGIPVGSSVSGFAVEFQWIGGSGGPGQQDYEIYDPINFDLLETGTTSSGGMAPVPEPSTILLLGSGMIFLIELKRKKFPLVK